MKLFMLLLLLSIPAHAEIYKWVDENGKVHFGDKVPEQYRKKADNVDVDVRQPSEQEIAEAEALNAELRQSRQSMEQTQKANRSSRSSSRPASGSSRDGKMSEYREAQACFAACAVTVPRPPRTIKTPQGIRYQAAGGTYRDLSNCGHCKNVKQPTL